MPYVLSHRGETLPDVVATLAAPDGRLVPFATSDGAFALPPEVTGSVAADSVVVALTAGDHARAVALGYLACESLDPCEVSG